MVRVVEHMQAWCGCWQSALNVEVGVVQPLAEQTECLGLPMPD